MMILNVASLNNNYISLYRQDLQSLAECERFSDQKDHGNIKESERIWTRRTPHSTCHVSPVSTAFFGVSIKAGSSGVAALRASKVRDFVLYLREEAKKEQETYSKEETRRNLWHQQVHWVDVPHKVKSTIVQF